MKKVFLMTMAALSILFTQCKKTEVTPAVTPTTENQVTISLNVGGSKVNVTPGTGTVTWENDDIIYVASHGAYVGTLTYDDANKEFKGTIADPTVGEPLFFYYLGNQTPTSTPTVGTTTVAVSIADQHEKFPVIAAGESNQNYQSYVTNYNSILRNKCGLVKFSATGYTGSGDITIKKMNNKVTIDFSKNLGYGGFTYDKENGGAITLNKHGDDYWAILLPQGEVTGGTQGDAYSSDDWAGTYGTVPAINNNSYETAGVAINIVKQWIDFNDNTMGVSGLPIWSKKNLGATNGATVETWYGNCYAWGETTTKSNYSSGTYTYSENPSVLDNAHDAAYQNALPLNTWRMPIETEWQQLVYNTYFKWEYNYNGIDGLNGFVVYKVKDAADKGLVTIEENEDPSDPSWVTINMDGDEAEVAGSYSYETDQHMFLPAAGLRNGTNLSNAGSEGYYWSSPLYSSDTRFAYCMSFFSSEVDPQSNTFRYFGLTVRPVR